MGTVGEEGSGALDAANDLVDLLRLAQGAAHRINDKVHSGTFEKAGEISQDIHTLRQKADLLRREIEECVARFESLGRAGGESSSSKNPIPLP